MKRAIVMMLALFLGSVNTISSAQDATVTVCSPDDLSQSQLVGGIETQVIADPIKVYRDISTHAELVAQLPTGTKLFITSGPKCNEENIWWQVKFDLHSVQGTIDFGWATEFKQQDRQLIPLIPTLNPTLPHNTSTITATNLSKISSTVEMGPFGDLIQFVWSANGEYLAINTLRTIWIYHVNTTEPNLAPYRLPPVALSFWNDIGSVAFSLDEQTVATVGRPDGDLRVWSTDGTEQKILHTRINNYTGVAAIAPDLSKWAIAHGDGSISVWGANTGMQLQTLTGHSVVGALAFTPDGSILVSMGGFPENSVSKKDNSVRIWDVTSGQMLTQLSIDMPPLEMTGGKSRIAISPDGKTATVFAPLTQKDHAVYLIDIADGSLRNQVSLSGSGLIGNTSFSADGEILAVNFAQSIVFINTVDGTQVAEIPFQKYIQEIALSPNGQCLAVAHEGDNFNKSIVQFWAVAE